MQVKSKYVYKGYLQEGGIERGREKGQDAKEPHAVSSKCSSSHVKEESDRL